MVARIMIMAGGTGGHVFPALAVAEELRARGVEVSWLGGIGGFEADVAQRAGFEFRSIAVKGLRGKRWTTLLTAPIMLLRAAWEAWQAIRAQHPHAVLGMGGFVAGPGGLVAKVVGIPLIIHEQNRLGGTTNRWLARLANQVLEAFPATFGHRGTWVGNPLRQAIARLSPKEFAENRSPRILVVGGSQGARALNEVVPKALSLLGFPVDVRHQTGRDMCDEVRSVYNATHPTAQVEPFFDDMADAYRWADIAICRAGAMTISELMVAALPAVLIPYPHAIDDHQTANARYLADRDAAVLLPQTELSPLKLSQVLADLIGDPERLRKMSRLTHALARPDAAQRVAEVCLQWAEAKSRG